MRDRHDPGRQERHRKRMERHAAKTTPKRPKTKTQLRGIIAQAKRKIGMER